jgi:hypothetical protein
MDKIDITDRLKNCRRNTKFELEQLCMEALQEIIELRKLLKKENKL